MQLPRDLVACPVNYGYRDFRHEVMEYAGIDPADYDVDSDGIVDSVWMVVSSQGHIGGDPGYEWLTGGAALVAGVKSFVDTQTAYAAAYRRYGAFNHEFAHNVGLPDLYGRYSTVEQLAFMGTTVGANILISSTFDRRNAGFGTFDWTEVCIAFEAPDNGVADIACGLGGWGSTSSGAIWCDDFRVHLPYSAF